MSWFALMLDILPTLRLKQSIKSLFDFIKDNSLNFQTSISSANLVFQYGSIITNLFGGVSAAMETKPILGACGMLSYNRRKWFKEPLTEELDDFWIRGNHVRRLSEIHFTASYLLVLLDHNSLRFSGHYMYIKTEGFPKPNFAILQTPKFAVTGPSCRLKFWYNINGIGKIGSLDVSFLMIDYHSFDFYSLLNFYSHFYLDL